MRDLIEAAETEFRDKNLNVLSNGKLKDGVLVFSRREGGGMDRIFDLSCRLEKAGGRIVMANLMGGG